MERQEIVIQTIDALSKISNSYKARGDLKGSNYFKLLISKYQNMPIDDVFSCYANLIRNLSGIEAHGHFTEEEYKLVTKIRELEKLI